MADPKKILIVEDDKFLALILKGRLEREGFVIVEAADGEEGLTKLRSEKPDLMVLDLIIPKKSGFEVLQAIKSDPQLAQTPILVASNLGQESDIEKAKGLGVTNYYVKAVTPVEDIVNMIKTALGVTQAIPQP